MLLLNFRSYILTLLLGLVILACDESEKNTPKSNSNPTTQEKQNPLLDSLETGIPLPVSLEKILDIEAPQVIKKGASEVTNANENIVQIQSPGIQLLGKNVTAVTPGNGGIALPIETVPTGEIRTVGFPEIIPAAPPATTDAAYYNLQYLDVDQGLSSSYVMDVVEDSRGNLWISTWSTGVCMYDSHSFVNYHEKNGLLNNYIWSIFEDSQGNLWFGSDGRGVSRYDGDSFMEFNESDGLAGAVVYKIIEDERNNLWFATNNGLSRFDGTSFYTYRTEQGLLGNEVSDISMGENNRLLIATNGGFSIFDGVLFTHYTTAQGLLDNNTKAVYEDSEGNIWIGTAENGICLFDGYTFFSYNTSHGLSGNQITSILEDDYNRIWIGTQDNGLSIYDRTSFTQISRPQGLNSPTVRTLYQDANMNIWIGTFSGLNKYNERSFKNYTDEQGLGGLIVRGICEDQYGNLWFGHSNGVSKYNGETYENFTITDGLGNNTVRAITQDYKGNIWFGTEGQGAIYYDGEQFISYKVENGMSDNTILSMYEDSDRNMWFGTVSGGVTKYDGENFYHFTMEEGLSSNTIRAFCEDNDGNLWIGTNSGGLEKFDGENLTHYTKKEGLSANTVLSLMLATDGKLWVGTENGGINIVAEEQFFSIGIEDGLTNGIIWSIVEDFEHNIWVGTEKGLNLIERRADRNFNISNFGKLDGLKGVDFYPNSVCLDSENRLWWGTGKALAMLDLKKYERIDMPPKLSITDILIDEASVDFRLLKSDEDYVNDNIDQSDLKKVRFDSVYKFSNFPSNIEVPYNLNHLTIQFSANDWTAPHKVKYVHKLEGASNEWHTLTDGNKVVHSYLPEGDYVFHLKAIGEAEKWSETIQFNITVHPPWWRTVWAYLGYFLLIVLAIGITTTLRTRKLIQQRTLLENLVNQRTEEVVKQKEIVELKNQEIIDSINYAKRIQRAILPSGRSIRRKIPKSLIFFKPKDIVAGDFYWMEEKKGKLLLAAADCTGHGVPGAMVSLVCTNTLSRTVREFEMTNPAQILNKVRDIVIESFTSSREEVKDGMDIALISYDPKTRQLQFAGANNNLYIVSNGEVKILKADRQPIGKYVVLNDFGLKETTLKEGDTIYMFTDGYTDQFGGPDEKKFKINRFINLLLEIQDLDMKQQKIKLEKVFNEWKGDLEQIDDVCVVGMKV